jgi:hypothetical protein
VAILGHTQWRSLFIFSFLILWLCRVTRQFTCLSNSAKLILKLIQSKTQFKSSFNYLPIGFRIYLREEELSFFNIF